MSACLECGVDRDLREGICFDCASAAERRAAKRSVLRHLWASVSAFTSGDAVSSRIFAKWAWERLTGTGDYAVGGTFDAEYPGWRDDSPTPKDPEGEAR